MVKLHLGFKIYEGRGSLGRRFLPDLCCNGEYARTPSRGDTMSNPRHIVLTSHSRPGSNYFSPINWGAEDAGVVDRS